MASWMVHLRIADTLLDCIPDLSAAEFIMGNIAPDSGVPNEDWSSFTPNKTVSHFKGEDKKAGPAPFAAKYFTVSQQKEYDVKQYSFYLGYLVHLLTDRLWSEKIAIPTMERHADAIRVDKRGTVNKIKDDWYDLDFLYLKRNPGFRAFKIFEGSVGFQNSYMEEFSLDAFDNRRAYISDFYNQDNENLDRQYPYLTEMEANTFVADSTRQILAQLNDYCR